jgi:hypothetical protein
MTRYSSKSMDETADRDSDNAQRRTRPEDHRPYSPAEIEKIYAKGKETISRKNWLHEEHQANQFIEDKHQDNGRGRYNNDTKGWLRGHGSVNGALYPSFDHGKLDPASKPPKPASGLRASGQDMTKSPFSAAYRRGAGEGF